MAVLSDAAPSLSNLTVAQRPGSRLVDLTYNLSAPGLSSVAIKLEISSDDGATWNVPAVNVTGAVGANIVPGNGKAMVWNAGVDWPDQINSQMRFRLTVDEGFALIPAGSFTMGRTSGDTDTNAPAVTVTISEFYMQQTETTKAQWDEVRAWAVNNGYTDLPVGSGKAANHPVHSLSWWDSVKWCNARSEKEGLMPVYSVGGLVMRTGTTTPDANWNANGYRLPTEAEWEKAARGGIEGKRFPWGTDDINHSNSNFRNNGGERYQSGTNDYHPVFNDSFTPYTSPVAFFTANGYGIFDASGNVREWCWDWIEPEYYSLINGTTDPKGPNTGTSRVIRGGSWIYRAGIARCTHRDAAPPASAGSAGGFRPARYLPQSLSLSSSFKINTTTLPVFTQTPEGQASVNPNTSVTFTATYVSGLQPFTYRWRRNGTALTGATGSSYTVAKVQKSHEGSYDCVITNSFGSFTTSASILTVNDPVMILTPPLTQAANVGQEVTLNVNITGTQPVEYQWRKNGTPIPDKKSSSLVLLADANSGGFYDVVVSNPVGSVTSPAATLTVLVPPAITAHPSNQNVSVGSSAFFSVTATGIGLTYQWRRNGTNITGQTNAMLMVSNVQKANEGAYDVLVKNSFGAVLSNPAWLSLPQPLSITEQPQDVTAAPGETASFSVTASGQGLLAYQWNKEGRPIKDAKSSTLTLPVTDSAASAGAYTVTVSSGTLKVTSAPAYLRVTDPGLLIYKFTITGNSFSGTRSSPIALTGLLIVDRLNQRGGIISYGKNGRLDTFQAELDEGLRTHSTGPITNSQTVVSKVVKTGDAPQEEIASLWLRGTDGAVTFSATDKTMAPRTLAGFQTELSLEGGTDVQSLSINATLDNAASLQARQAGETVEQTLNRLSAGLQQRGFIRE